MVKQVTTSAEESPIRLDEDMELSAKTQCDSVNQQSVNSSVTENIDIISIFHYSLLLIAFYIILYNIFRRRG